MRKTISLVLAVLMMLVLLPAVKLSHTASAEDAANTYALVTSANDLTAGGTYLLVGADTEGKTYALGKQNTNTRAAVPVTVTSDKTIVLTAAQLAATVEDDAPFALKLGGSAADGWSFYDAVGEGYLYAAGTGDRLRTQATNDSEGLFALTFDETALTVVSKGEVEQKNLLFNPNDGSPVFSCYADDSLVQGAVSLYKLKETVTPTGDTIVLFTNDVHCQVDYAAKELKDDGTVKSAGAWGYGKLAGLKKSLEDAGNEVILVDAGDHIQGGPIGSLTQGEAIIDIMNAVGYDLAIPGNHEFDYGMDQFLNVVVKNAKYPYLSANFVNLVENNANGLVFDAYKIIEANGKKIAFVGLSTPESITKSTPAYFMNEDQSAYVYGFCQDQTGEGVIAAAQKAIDAAKAEGADYVIVVGHMGIDEQSSPWMSTEVIPNITGADAFIDGHSHTVINAEVADKDGKKVLHGQTGTKFENVGKLTIAKDGTLTMELLSVDEAGEPDPTAQAVIDKINAEFEELLDTVVAHTDHLLTISDPETGERWVRSRETNLGDLCADAYRYMFDSDIAFVNGGGVRANIAAGNADGDANGDITFRDIINVHPFGNTAVLVEVTGQQILDALEMGARVCPSENGGFLQVSGLTYEIHTYLDPNVTIDTSKLWTGTAGLKLYRVQNVKIYNKETETYEPLNLTKKYTLASHNYMLMQNGDGFAMFGKNVTVLEDSGKLDNQVLIDYIQSMPADEDGVHQVTGYTNPEGEGRIKIVSEAAAPTGDTIILFTNDVHCGIRDGWGYAGVADLRNSLELAGNEVILVDAGDHIQGGPIGSLTQGEAIIDIMNAVGYDLATIGNHEFDYGMDPFLNVVAVNAEYPYLSANFVNLVENNANGLVFDAYKIIEANGKKIAFVGLSTPESITKSTPTYFMNEDQSAYIYGFCQDDTGIGVYTAAQNAIDAAREEGADYVIVVGHMGIDEQSSPWMSTEVIPNITGADAFIDGHSHTVINAEVADKDGHTVLHGQTGTKLANVGKLTIKADGTLTMEILPASQKVQDDPFVNAVIAEIEAEFQALLNTVVAHTDHLLTISDPETGTRWVRSRETNLGDLCADAYRTMFDADIAFVNGGGVRANIKAGNITFQDIINVHPFGNTAVLAEVTGQQILDALEMGARSNPGENGGFLQVSGLTYEIHSYIEPNVVIGSDKMWQGPVDPALQYRVQNVQVFNKETEKYEPLDLEKKYTLASHNYMLIDMGDGFAMFGKNATILEDSGKLDNQVLIDYIQSMPADEDGVHQVTGYVEPEGEGRITIISEPGAMIYGERVNATDIAEYGEENTIYHYDIMIANVPEDQEVVGIQAFIKYDPKVLTFLDATSTLDGTTGINASEDQLMFAWASNGEGIKVEDGTVVVTLNFELAGPVQDNQLTPITFIANATGETSGYSYVDGTTVKEATDVVTVDGTITFDIPNEFTLVGSKVDAMDVVTKMDGVTAYRYDIKVKDLPKSGLMINSASIYLSFDKDLIAFVSGEGPVEWSFTDKGDSLMAVWASEKEVALNEDDVILSVYFRAKEIDQDVEIGFTTSALGYGSAVSIVFGGKVIEVEAVTEDGVIRFAGLLGDANCDGQVTASDASAILRSLVALDELSAQGAINADVDGDGEVTAADAAAILRYIVRLIDKFPAEE